MALRPDLTMPIARMAALSLGERAAVGRYCYIGQAYGRDNSRSGMQREFTLSLIHI